MVIAVVDALGEGIPSTGQRILAEQTLLVPAAVRLAELASIATFVEPELLRRLRLGVDRDVTVDAEVDLWLGPLVESRAPRGIVLRRDVVNVLRARLATSPARLARAREIVQDVHAVAPPSALLEEKIVWLALAPGDQTAAIEAALRTVTKAMVDEPTRGKDVARWAVRALPRLPAAARETVAAWTLALSAGARLDGRHVLSGDAPKGALDELTSLLPSATARTAVGLRLTPDALEISVPPPPAGVTLEVPATNPIVLGVTAEPDDPPRTATLRPGESRMIPVDEQGQLELTAGDGARWGLTVPEADVTLVLLEDPTVRAARRPARQSDEDAVFIAAPRPDLEERAKLRDAIEPTLLGEGGMDALLDLGRRIGRAMPGDLWSALDVAARRHGVAPSLLVVSDTLDLPWELAVMPSPPDPSLPPFLGVQCMVGSWVVPGERRDLPRPRPIAIDVRTLGALAATHQREQVEEAPIQENAASSQGGLGDRRGIGELVDRFDMLSIRGMEDLRRWLHEVRPDLLHIAGQVIVDPYGTTRIDIENEDIDVVKLIERDAELDGSFVYLGADGSGPLFASELGLQPLVESLIATGAAGVVAPTAPPVDQDAVSMALRFYDHVLGTGHRPAEALRQMRSEAASGGPMSRAVLGYRFFGHPMTTLTRRSSIRLWDLAPEGVFSELDGDASEFQAVAWSPDGMRLVTGSDDGAIRLWHASGRYLGTIGQRPSPVRRVAWSPDGTRVAIGAQDDLSIWTPVPTLAAQPTVSLSVRETSGIDWSPNGDRLAIVDGEGLHVVDAATGDRLAAETGEWFSGMVAWPLEETVVASLGTGELKLFAAIALATSRRLEAEPGLLTAHASSADGSILVTADQQGLINVLDVRTGEVIRRMEAQLAHLSSVVAMWLSATELRTADEAGFVSSWRLDEGEPSPLRRVLETPGAVFSPDGMRLATVRSERAPSTSPGDRPFATSAA